MVPFWVPLIIWHLIFRIPKRDNNFDNHPYVTPHWCSVYIGFRVDVLYTVMLTDAAVCPYLAKNYLSSLLRKFNLGSSSLSTRLPLTPS